MADHPTAQELEQYCQRALSPAALLAVQRHVGTCPRCAVQCDSPQQLARDFEDLRTALLSAPDDAPYHLSATEVAAYLRSELSEIDLEIAESHLITCATCRGEVQRRKEAAIVEPDVSGRGVRTARPDFRRGWQLPYQRLDGWRPWRIAAVIFCGAILILLALFLLRTKNADHTEQAVHPENTNDRQDSLPVDARTEAERNRRTPEAQPNNAGEPHTAPTTSEGGLPATQLLLVLNDGGQRVTLDRRGELAGLERLPMSVRQAVKAALQTGRLERPPALAQLVGRPSTLLSQSDDGLPFQLLSPVGQVVQSEQPTFRWGTLAGAGSYTVTVTDADLNEVATSPPLGATEWRITKPLRPGAIYSWQVTARKDGEAITSPVLPAPQAKFKVLDRATLEMLRQTKRSYAGSHLTAGVLYTEAGLLSEAEQEFRALVRANPRTRTARELLRSVQAMRQRRACCSRRAHRSSPISMNPAQ